MDDSDVEGSLWRALRLRSSYLKGQVESLTLPGVRRLLEEDLGLEPTQLDAHKKLIRGLVDKVLNSPDDGDKKKFAGTEKRRKNSTAMEALEDEDKETNGSTKRANIKRRRLVKSANIEEKLPNGLGKRKLGDEDTSEKGANEGDAEIPERSGDSGEKSVTEGKEGLFEGHDKAGKAPAHLHKEAEGISQDPAEKNGTAIDKADDPPEKIEDCDEERAPTADGECITEDAIRSALVKRADELKAQAESLTLTSVRRLLQQDLGTGPDGLGEHRKFIRSIVDEILDAADEKAPSKASKAGRPKQAGPKSSGDSKGNKKGVAKASLGSKIMQGEEADESEDKLQEGCEVSDSASEGRKARKAQKNKNDERKTKAAATKKTNDGKRPFSANVERLRDILKAVGIGVPPSVYRKAKQAPEGERDEILTKELENKLNEHGLSPNPSEKEIRKVKTTLQKRKDLDGIEHSNIVAEPRRSRAAANSWFTPRASSYKQMADAEDDSGNENDSDGDKPTITGAMDDQPTITGAMDDKLTITGAMDD